MAETGALHLQRDGVVWRAVDGQVVVLDLRTSEYLQVNEAGALLFDRLDQGASRSDLVAALQAAYEIEPERAERDVDAFLTMLRSRDLLAP